MWGPERLTTVATSVCRRGGSAKDDPDRDDDGVEKERNGDNDSQRVIDAVKQNVNSVP